jgi:UDP-GlcNAc:undecaprenyl-phosphate/decaprenyl-phosphate GlcNAc-1-phosphate transferase
MPDELRITGAFAVALLVTLAATPVARSVAIRTNFYDQPVGYKGHRCPTPYLGGAAVLAGFVLAALAFADVFSRYAALLVCVIGLFAVGTADDRFSLGVFARLGVQVASALVLWAAGIGWQLFSNDAANAAVTIVWVVGLINALNLMDNLDGATGTVAAVCSAGAGALALIQGDAVLAALALALSGACAGFLPYNLANPSRIFLGDGGSMPIGLVLAAVVMAIPAGPHGSASLLALIPLAGLPILDTTLVVVSRHRRGATVLSGARDHITHRLLGALGSERRVLLTLAIAQALACGLAIGLHQLGDASVLAAAVAYVAVGAGIIALLETPRWLPSAEEQRA